MLLCKQQSLVVMANHKQLFDALPNQIEHLTDTHEDTDSAGHHHEQHEDLFLCGPTDETVHCVRTRSQGTFGKSWKIVSMINPIEDVEERYVESSFEDETEQISPPQAASLFAWVGVQVGSVVLGHVLHVFSLPKLHMSDDHERGAGDEDELQCPQADVGDGEDVIVADVGATRLSCVADKILALVAPHSLSCHHENHHSEHKHHGQPDPPERCGVFIHSTEEALQTRPVHPCNCCSSWGSSLCPF